MKERNKMKGLRRNKKRVLGFVLALVMVVSVITSGNMFEVKAETGITDTKAPVITDISIDKQGQVVTEGKVTITFTAWDESGFSDEYGATITLKNPETQSYTSTSLLPQRISTSEDGKTATYSVSTWITSWDNGEWYLDEIVVHDVHLNKNVIYANKVNVLRSYYFYVGEQKETTYNNVTINLRDKNYNLLATTGATTLARRTDVSKALGDNWIDALEDHNELGKFVCWQFGGDLLSQNNEVCVWNDNVTIDLVPVYEKQTLDLQYTYMNKNLDFVTGYKKLLLPYDAIYSDVLDTLNIPTISGCNLLGWNLATYSQDTFNPVYGYLWITAQYDHYPVTVNTIYADNNGNVVKEADTKLYPANSNMQEIIDTEFSAIDSSIRNSATDWEKSSYSGTLSSAREINFIANYDDKVTVEYYTSYIANTEESTEYGVYCNVTDYLYVSNEDASSKTTFVNAVKSKLNLNLFDGFTTVSHSCNYYQNRTTGLYDSFEMLDPSYDKNYVNLHDDGYVTGENYSRYYVPTSDIFYLPTEHNGETLYWYDYDKDVYYTGSIEMEHSDHSLTVYTEIEDDAVVINNPVKSDDTNNPTTPPTDDDDKDDPVTPPTDDGDKDDPVTPPTDDKDDPVTPPTESTKIMEAFTNEILNFYGDFAGVEMTNEGTNYLEDGEEIHPDATGTAQYIDEGRSWWVSCAWIDSQQGVIVHVVDINDTTKSDYIEEQYSEWEYYKSFPQATYQYHDGEYIIWVVIPKVYVEAGLTFDVAKAYLDKAYNEATNQTTPVEKNDYKAEVTNTTEITNKIELTQAEKEAIDSGATYDIVLTFKDKGANATTEEQKFIEKELEDKEIGTFLEIDLSKKIGAYETKLSETKGMIEITFELPQELRNTDTAVHRTYNVARYHDGKMDVLDAEYDDTTGKLSFETDKFSTYAVVYSDVKTSTPTPDDPTPSDPVTPPTDDDDKDDPVTPPTTDDNKNDPVTPPTTDDDKNDPVTPPTTDDSTTSDSSAPTTTPNTNTAPKTADITNMIIYIVLCGLAIYSVLVVLRKQRKF